MAIHNEQCGFKAKQSEIVKFKEICFRSAVIVSRKVKKDALPHKMNLVGKNSNSKHAASLGTASFIPHNTLHANRENHYITKNLKAYLE